MIFHLLLRTHFYRLALINLGHVSPSPMIRLIVSTYWPVNKKNNNNNNNNNVL